MTIDYHILKYSHNKKSQVDFNINYFDLNLYKIIWKYIYDNSEYGDNYKESIIKLYLNKKINISQLNKLQRCIHWSLPCQYSIDNNNINCKHIICELCPFEWLTAQCYYRYFEFKKCSQIIKNFNRNINKNENYINYNYVIEAKKKYKKIAFQYMNLKLKDGIKIVKNSYDLK